ncbi:MAG: response regulator [Verrucomicrobia bacterium]|nr:MAG: response regulator [Verrucomicrobiota bacterium]
MQPKRILVIDDEPSITQLLKLNLQKTGRFTVRTENLGANALQAAREFEPDLILLDVMLPDIQPHLDGGDVAAQIRSEPALKDTPIVFLTAVVKKGDVQSHGGVIGGFPYIAKPLDVKGVIAVIEQNLAK